MAMLISRCCGHRPCWSYRLASQPLVLDLNPTSSNALTLTCTALYRDLSTEKSNWK
ncbi:hypothetical protein [Prochlorococcus marinus]|uniref:hypothetical protein n=1 Tax=Prochlorococcus marinus TaxID=1219 RepID=UPI000AB12201|nr:hypothetical protein [Prochlorococcus marinus]